MTNTTNTSANTERDAKQKVIQSVADLDMRDYFAAKAMQAWFTDRTLYLGDKQSRDKAAKQSYEMADAMLKARLE